MSLVRLNIKGISYSQTQNGAYALILNEVNGDRKLPIVIGAFEAQSIAIALEKEILPSQDEHKLNRVGIPVDAVDGLHVHMLHHESLWLQFLVPMDEYLGCIL